jgi:ABC-2 type transport system permease protein
MTGAAVFLITRGLKNRIVRWFMRLRQPRYVAGAALAGLYFWSFLFRHRAGVVVTPMPRGSINEIFVIAITIIATLMILGAWALPNESPGFVFSEAEIQFLFPAPITRRQLLAYKVMQSQIGLLFTSAVMSFLAFRGSRYAGVWIAFAVLNVYLMFVSFARARLKLAGIGWAIRLGAVFVALTALIATAAWQFRSNAAVLVNALTTGKFANYGSTASSDLASTVSAIMHRPPLGPMLAVPRLFGEIMYSPSIATLLRNGAILISAAVVLFFAAVYLDVSFEDASIVASQRALVRRGRMRSMRGGSNLGAVHRFPAPFRLAERGRPEIAVFWKNLVAAMRVSSFPVIAVILPVAFAAAGSIFRGHGAAAASLGYGGLMTAAGLALFGPQIVRTDLRIDILRLDIVKTFPLTAEALLAAELAAPLVIVSGLALLMLGVSFALLNFGNAPPSFVTSPEFIVCALVFIVPVAAIQLLIQNGATILLPAWSMNSDGNRGLTALGQRMLLLLATLITLVVALLPAAVVFAGSLFGVTRLLGRSPATFLIAAVPAAAILAGEIAVAHRFLAAQFDEIDIANDLENATP